MNLFFLDTTNVLSTCILLFVIGQILSSLEFCYLIFHNEYSNDGYCPWQIISLEKPIVYNSKITTLFFKNLYSDFGLRILIILKLLILIGLLIVPIKSLPFTVFIFILLATHFLMHFRNPYGGEGSDQMSIIVLVALCIGASFFSGELTSLISIVFIAAQSLLSYISAGLAKLSSKKWRGGTAVFEIFNTGSFGHKTVATIISKKPNISFFLSWSVIVMECLFPIAIFFPQPYITFSFLIWGVVFHFFNAFIMGLNAFFWIFLSTYPCILFLFLKLHSFIV